MANVAVDGSLCTGCGLCESNCPEVFKVGDDGIAQVIGDKCSCNQKEIVDQCPVSAISIK